MKLCVFSAAAVLLLSACQSTVPNVDSMDKYYREAEASVQRDVGKLHDQMNSGAITQAEYDSRAEAIRNSVGERASKLAWTRHELVEAQKRSMGIPTGDTPVMLGAPNRGGDSFYRQAGQGGGQGYSGTGSGMWHGYQPGSMAGSMGR